MNPEMIVALVIVACAAMPVTYLLGLMFSRGFHRGKREFLSRLMTESVQPRE